MSEGRLARVQNLLALHDCDALLLTDLLHVRYATGFSGSNGASLVAVDEVWLATDSRYELQAAVEAADARLLIGRDLVGLLLEAVGTRECVRVAVEADRMPYAGYLALERRLADSGVEIVDASGWIAELRQVKDDAEIALIEAACEITVASWWQLLAEGVIGRSEADLAGRLEHLFRLHGASGPAFDSIVATGSNSAIPHHQPTDRLVAAGDLLKIDCGAKLQGYHADFTRTVAVGAAAEWQTEIHQIVRSTQAEVAAKVGPASDAADLDRLAHELISAAGYGDHFGHGTGHGVGLEIHEPPFLGRQAGILRPRMTVTVEPGIYLAGRGGVRIEDTLLVTEAGHRQLTQAERGLLVV